MASLPKLPSRPRPRQKPQRKLTGALEGTPTKSCPDVFIHQSKHAAGIPRRRGVALESSSRDSLHLGHGEAQRMDPLKHLQHFSAAVDSRVAAFLEASENFPCKRVGNYLLGKKLGEGAFAKVRLGLHRLTGQKVAVKIYSKDSQTDSYVLQNITREVSLMSRLRHPNIIQLLDMIETEKNYYLVMEACMKGSLLDVVEARGCLSAEEAREYFIQLVSAVNHLHANGIIHRDIKLDNLLLTSSGTLKLIDFGLSNNVGSQTLCGSPLYAAPEMLGAKSYGEEVDIWSIGACLFIMLMGSPPYKPEDAGMAKLHANMMMGRMSRIKDSLSVCCQDLILRLLQYDPKQRINVSAILAHPWVTMKGLQPVPVVPVSNWLLEEEIDPAILGFMASDEELICNVNSGELVQDLLANRPTAATATYHLLVGHFREVMKKEQGKVMHRSVSDHSLCSIDRTELQSRKGRRRRHVSENQLPPLAPHIPQSEDKKKVSKPRAFAPRLHQRECTPSLPGASVPRHAPASEDHRLMLTQNVPHMDLHCTPTEQRSKKTSSGGTGKEHAGVVRRKLSIIDETPIVLSMNEPQDPLCSDVQCMALPHSTRPATDMHALKAVPRQSKMKAVQTTMDPFEVEREHAASNRWVWKRPDYDASFSDTDSSRTQGSSGPNDLTTTHE